MKKIIPFIILVIVAYAVFPFLLRQANCDPDLGTGVLYVYTDKWGGTLASKDAKDHYLVTLGNTYHISIWGITEFAANTDIEVWISWTDNTGTGQTTKISTTVYQHTSGTLYANVTWTVPSNAMTCNDYTSVVKYTLGQGNKVYLAVDGVIDGKPAHMHLIPTTLLGALGSVLALFTSLGLYKIRKKE